MTVPSSLLFAIVMDFVIALIYFLIKLRYNSKYVKGNLIVARDTDENKDLLFLELTTDTSNLKNGDYVTLLVKRSR